MHTLFLKNSVSHQKPNVGHWAFNRILEKQLYYFFVHIRYIISVFFFDPTKKSTHHILIKGLCVMLNLKKILILFTVTIYTYILIQTSRSSWCSLPRADCDASLISSHGESDSQTQPEHYICRRKKNKRRQIFAVEGVDSICLCSPPLPELMHIELSAWFPITWIWVVSDSVDFPPRVLESGRAEHMEDKKDLLLCCSVPWIITFTKTRFPQHGTSKTTSLI